MKFALAQINPTIGCVAANAEKIEKQLEEASSAKVDLVVFPELAVTGYPPQDLLDSSALVEASQTAIHRLARAAKRVTGIIGFVEKNPHPHGRPFYNAAAVLREGKVSHVYRKRLLPNYDVFDEPRYFEPGGEAVFFEQKGEKVALTICEDIWNIPGFLPRAYGVQPLDDIQNEGVDWIINLSASPFHLGKPALREKLFSLVVQRAKAGLLFCNQVGGNDDLLFDGGSLALNRSGKCLTRARFFEEGLYPVEEARRSVSPCPAEDSEWLTRALEMGLRDYLHKTGAKRVVIGLSGGVDSSVVAAIAVRALGPENVKGVLLPTQFTSAPSNQDALLLATNLGVSTLTLPVQGLFTQTLSVLQQALNHSAQALTQENVQPRLRMLLLMALANEENALLLNTSNKSEIATGYATQYGDATGALSVLGDLTKDQVYALARYFNSERTLIPTRVLERPPTAELRADQTDEQSLPPYEQLNPMVHQTVERGAAGAELASAGFAEPAIQNFLTRYRQSEFKRRQFPPILRVSPRAFGRGRRVPIASCKPW